MKKILKVTLVTTILAMALNFTLSFAASGETSSYADSLNAPVNYGLDLKTFEGRLCRSLSAVNPFSTQIRKCKSEVAKVEFENKGAFEKDAGIIDAKAAALKMVVQGCGSAESQAAELRCYHSADILLSGPTPSHVRCESSKSSDIEARCYERAFYADMVAAQKHVDIEEQREFEYVRQLCNQVREKSQRDGKLFTEYSTAGLIINGIKKAVWDEFYKSTLMGIIAPDECESIGFNAVKGAFGSPGGYLKDDIHLQALAGEITAEVCSTDSVSCYSAASKIIGRVDTMNVEHCSEQPPSALCLCMAYHQKFLTLSMDERRYYNTEGACAQ